ncbi:MAG: amidohydrolase family protein [Solirubrobacteraceae bacterium]
MKTDIHQHLWTEPLVEALARRRELPFVRDEQGLTVLFGAGERPYVIDLDGETSARRAELVQRDGLDRALVCLSSPLGIEPLPRQAASELIDAYLDGALALDDRFGVWAPLALSGVDPNDVDSALERGCVGISLPAGALGSIDSLALLAPALARVQSRGAPLFVHPGPGNRLPVSEASLGDPLWWPALTRYVAEMQAAWLVWVTAARRLFPELRVVFAMLAGLAPLHTERLRSRGGPATRKIDPLVFYDTSSYGPQAVGLMERAVGVDQLVYGSDRPVVDPGSQEVRDRLDWRLFSENAARVFAHGVERGSPPPRIARPTRARPKRIAVLERAAL